MYVSLRFENEKDGAGSIMIYRRASMTCRNKVGQIDYETPEEKKILKHMLMTSHPEVEVIGDEVRIGNFVDVYMKGKL